MRRSGVRFPLWAPVNVRVDGLQPLPERATKAECPPRCLEHGLGDLARGGREEARCGPSQAQRVLRVRGRRRPHRPLARQRGPAVVLENAPGLSQRRGQAHRPRPRFRDLRHFAATRLLTRGVDVRTTPPPRSWAGCSWLDPAPRAADAPPTRSNPQPPPITGTSTALGWRLVRGRR